jgi:chromate transporter
MPAAAPSPTVPLRTVLREWGRIGLTGFGGPPAHIALLRRLVVDDRGWISRDELEAAIAACNLLPGPASTQLAIFCAYRVAGRRGAVVGGLAFIVPAVVIVLALSVLFLGSSPPRVVRGAGLGAGSAVAAVAVSAGLALLHPSWRRAASVGAGRRARWLAYVIAGGSAAASLGPYVVLVLLGCGLIELIWVAGPLARDRLGVHATPLLLWPALASAGGAVGVVGGLGALAWVAFKVGALSYGGGFVIIPLMQHDAVHTYHWMSSSQFLDAVALGQVSPGPVVATVAAIGYAAHGVGGGLLASFVAFAPSFAFILVGGGRFERLRSSARAQAFLDGAGPAAIGAILGAAIPLAGGLHHLWQFLLLAAAAVALLVARRGVVETLLGAGAVGVAVALLGGPLS